jgi:ADP-ribose pyrophosphatase
MCMYTSRKSIPVYKSQWMVVCEDLVTNEDGTIGMFNRITNVHNAATIVPIFEDGSLLMVENYRHGIGATLLDLPGGRIREKEEPTDTAKRELLEETGYTCDALELINWFYTWPARATQRNFVFIATGLKKISEQNLEDFEYIKACKITREQAIQELKNGNIKNAVTISALLHGYFVE